MFPARAARALPSTVELTVNLFKDSVTSDVMEEAVVGGEEMDSWSDAFKDWTDSGIGEVTVGGSGGGLGCRVYQLLNHSGHAYSMSGSP